MYDVIVIGGGPAGVTAAIYAVRGGLKTAMFEKMYVGGQITTTSEMVNYPGFAKPIDGVDFSEALADQADSLGIETIYEAVNDIKLDDKIKVIKTKSNTYEAKAVIIASGASYKKLGLPSEQKFSGRGVSYCATCDGNFYKEKVVGIVGSGNHAVGEAIYLAKLSSKVHLFNRGTDFNANEKLINILLNNTKIEVHYNSEVDEILGDQIIDGVIIHNNQTEEKSKIELSGLFVAIGRTPDVGFLNPDCVDQDGHIVTDENMVINTYNGVFAAGDVRAKKLRQVATAVGDGAIAGDAAIDYLKHFEE